MLVHLFVSELLELLTSSTQNVINKFFMIDFKRANSQLDYRNDHCSHSDEICFPFV